MVCGKKPGSSVTQKHSLRASWHCALCRAPQCSFATLEPQGHAAHCCPCTFTPHPRPAAAPAVCRPVSGGGL